MDDTYLDAGMVFCIGLKAADMPIKMLVGEPRVLWVYVDA